MAFRGATLIFFFLAVKSCIVFLQEKWAVTFTVHIYCDLFYLDVLFFEAQTGLSRTG